MSKKNSFIFRIYKYKFDIIGRKLKIRDWFIPKLGLLKCIEPDKNYTLFQSNSVFFFFLILYLIPFIIIIHLCHLLNVHSSVERFWYILIYIFVQILFFGSFIVKITHLILHLLFFRDSALIRLAVNIIFRCIIVSIFNLHIVRIAAGVDLLGVDGRRHLIRSFQLTVVKLRVSACFA